MLVFLKPTPERVPSRKHATTFAHDHTVDGRTPAPPFKNPGIVRRYDFLWFQSCERIQVPQGVNSWHLWGDQEGKPELDVEVLEEPENWEGGVESIACLFFVFCGAEHKSAEFFFCRVSLKFRHFCSHLFSVLERVLTWDRDAVAWMAWEFWGALLGGLVLMERFWSPGHR